MAQLTDDDKARIGADPVFQQRIGAVLREKAMYWLNAATSARADVNRQMQKRKRLSKSILQSSWVDSYRTLVAQYWITQYVEGNPDLDGNQIPNVTAISNAFDPTYDYWAGVNQGDNAETEIEW